MLVLRMAFKQTAALMRRCIREHDLVARIGGPEAGSARLIAASARSYSV